jgi:hypothetical protein
MRVYVCYAPPLLWAPPGTRPVVKIGVSINPQRRKWNLRWPNCSHPQVMWQSRDLPYNDALASERLLKRRFAKVCVGGFEWFRLAPNDAIQAAREVVRHVSRIKATQSVLTL